MSDMDSLQSSELLRLQEKVKALERQNELLKQSKTGDSNGGAAVKRISIISTGDDEDIKLLEMDDLEFGSGFGSEENWLFDLSNGEQGGLEEDEGDWLKTAVMSPDSSTAAKKKSLVNKLDDIAKRSPSHSAYRHGGQNGSFSTSSPYKSLTTSPPSSKYSNPGRGSQFDPRTFTRTQAGKTGVGAYSLPPEDDEPKVRKPSYHRLNFGAKNSEENILNYTHEKEDGGNLTFTPIDKANTTFNKTSDNLTDNQNALNLTFDRNMSPSKDALNSTFTRNGTPLNQNSTFSRTSGDPSTSGTLNATFEKEGTVTGSANHRKMSEDRMSSASSRLSRESSQDILVEDLDRLSTTSAMSESSVSHRLNDVQDVQDIARMQEESLKHSTPMKNMRSDTISPLSEHSLSSPVEDGGGYQSEESCGSESGVVRAGPRRGEVQPRLPVYSSQDSLPDSPYSSQSLDSHASHGGQEVRRSMPNLNKLRGGKVGQAPSSQYGLSQAKYHNSESRLQNPNSRLAAPSYRGAPGARTLRAPGSSGLMRPGTVSGLRPPGERKLSSGIARPQGLPRPTSRLQQPGSYMRSGLAVRGGSGRGRVAGQRTDNKNWLEDCY